METMGPAAPEQTQPASAGSGSALSAVFGVLTSPTKAFSQIKQMKNGPRLLVPLITLAVIYIIMGVLVYEPSTKMQMDLQRDMVERFRNSGNEQVARQIEAGIKKPPMWQSVLVIGVMFVAVLPIITALLMWLLGNYAFGGKAKFMAVWGLAAYAGLTFGVGQLVTGLLIASKGTMTVSLSPAILVAGDGVMTYSYQLLSRISIPHIWEIITAGIGLSIMYDFSRNKGMWLSVVSLGTMAVAGFAMAAIQIMFMRG